MEVRHVWSRIRFFPWFRATLTSWLYMATKDHMKKYQKEYRQFLVEIGPEAFKRPLLTHRNAITTGWKRVGRVSRDNTKARESMQSYEQLGAWEEIVISSDDEEALLRQITVSNSSGPSTSKARNTK